MGRETPALRYMHFQENHGKLGTAVRTVLLPQDDFLIFNLKTDLSLTHYILSNTDIGYS